MKMNKKILVAIMTIIVGVAVIGANAFAVGNARRDNIKSKGIIDYANGTVVINASDLTNLADEIDALESAYKKNTLIALNSVGTYFKTDGTYTHNQEEGTITSEYAETLNFSNFFEGILQSQSVDHLAGAQAQDADGNLLYYADESASESNNLIMTTTSANEFPILIRPAGDNNLTAGTAAWVNGTLIIGNGADNQAYYEQGYRIGYADGYSDHAPSGASIEYIYHYHSESCPQIECHISWYQGGNYGDGTSTAYQEELHHECGLGKITRRVPWDVDKQDVTWETTHWVYKCGYENGQRIGATIIWNN